MVVLSCLINSLLAAEKLVDFDHFALVWHRCMCCSHISTHHVLFAELRWCIYVSRYCTLKGLMCDVSCRLNCLLGHLGPVLIVGLTI